MMPDGKCKSCEALKRQVTVLSRANRKLRSAMDQAIEYLERFARMEPTA